MYYIKFGKSGTKIQYFIKQSIDIENTQLRMKETHKFRHAGGRETALLGSKIASHRTLQCTAVHCRVDNVSSVTDVATYSSQKMN